VAAHSNKVKEDDVVDKLFGERPVHEFLYEDAKTSNSPSDDLLRTGVLILTMERCATDGGSVASLLTPDFGYRFLDSPTSHHDLVLVCSDGEEVGVHKFALAGQCPLHRDVYIYFWID
jgi:hypothetical protein